MEPVVRLTRPGDINSVTTMDLKCYHYPMPMEEWQGLIKGSGKEDQARIVLIEVYGQPAGFAMWAIDIEQVVSIYRLGVLPKYRRRGLGKLLLAACAKNGWENHCDKMRVTIPDILCAPGDPDDVSAFLIACGFKPTGEIIYDFKVMYGRSVDGYIFQRGTHAFEAGR